MLLVPHSASLAPAPVAPAALGWDRRRTRLLHRVLAGGTDDVAAFRGWDRLLRWRADPSVGSPRPLARHVLTAAQRAWHDAERDVARFGAAVTAAAGTSIARQRRQLWWLKVRHGIGGRAYVEYQLYRPERWQQAPQYLQVAEFFRVARYLARHAWPEAARTLWDRTAFEGWCQAHALPTAPVLLAVDGRRDVSPADLPPQDLFTKPDASTGGEGAERWRYDGAGGYTGWDGQTRSAAALVAELTAAAAQPGPRGQPRAVLVKPCLVNHRALLSLTPGGLCTVRVVTYRAPGETPGVALAVYKMPTGAEAADNFCHGGVAAPVDLATGRLGAAIHRVAGLLTTIPAHPDTGARIPGTVLPHWAAAHALVRRAHAALPAIGVVGWDVAILDDGPVIIEGNSVPNPELSQAASGVPLGATPVVRCLTAHLAACVGDHGQR